MTEPAIEAAMVIGLAPIAVKAAQETAPEQVTDVVAMPVWNVLPHHTNCPGLGVVVPVPPVAYGNAPTAKAVFTPPTRSAAVRNPTAMKPNLCVCDIEKGAFRPPPVTD